MTRALGIRSSLGRVLKERADRGGKSARKETSRGREGAAGLTKTTGEKIIVVGMNGRDERLAHVIGLLGLRRS